MDDQHFAPAFFLGANTADGFFSLSNEMLADGDDVTLYLLKGGPGTGKSSVMKAVCAKAKEENIPFERIFCSSDPDSLDAVLLPTLHMAVCDATPPHPFELKFPGVCGRILDMGLCWNAELLKREQEKILSLSRANSSAHAGCQRFLSAAGRMQAERMQIALEHTDLLRVIRSAKRLAAKYIPAGSGESLVTQRFLSACTPKGEVVFYDTLTSLCPLIIAVEDDLGAVSAAFMQTVLHEAVRKGQRVIACPDILRPNGTPEHILLPDAGLAFFTSDRRHPAPDTAERIVRGRSFADTKALQEYKNRLSFYRRAIDELCGGAVEKLERAKLLHDRLEAHYIAAMDFGKAEKMKNELLEEVFGESLFL